VKLEPVGLTIFSLEYRTRQCAAPVRQYATDRRAVLRRAGKPILDEIVIDEVTALEPNSFQGCDKRPTPGGSRYQPPASGVERASFKDCDRTLASPIVVCGFVASSAFIGCISVSIV
jgi:hypothetical protein